MKSILPVQHPTHEGEAEDKPMSPLQLVNKKIKLKFSAYRISNTPNKMIPAESEALSSQGVQFASALPFPPGTLLRIWIELPDYWARKSQHVGYGHTEAPTHFQMLCRVVRCQETNKRAARHQLLCETVNVDRVDSLILNDFLGVPHLSIPSTVGEGTSP